MEPLTLHHNRSNEMKLLYCQVVEPLLIPPLYSHEFGKFDHLNFYWSINTSRFLVQVLRSQQLLLSSSESLELVRLLKISEFSYEELEATLDSEKYSNNN